MKKITSAIIICLTFSMILKAQVVPDQMIKQHGKYSKNYLSSWSTLPNGKDYPRKKVSDYSFTSQTGENVKKTYNNQDSVYISSKYWKVKWNNAFSKYGNTLFFFNGCRKVVIEDMAIIQMDGDWRASHAFLFEDCGEIIIRNVYISGSVNTHHIKMEGCEYVFIDNVEISGYNYGGSLGTRCGHGIYINNGEVGKACDGPCARNLKFSVIQNCYIHDNLYVSNPKRNNDGIIVTSAADGILFNNYVENWYGGDGAFDVSHRRSDNAYMNHVYRVERNIVKNNLTAKTSGGNGGSTNHIFGANNIFINTQWFDYHDNYENFWVHNTYVYSPSRTDERMLKHQGIQGTGQFRNNLVYVYNNPVDAIHFGYDVSKISADHNAYVMPTPGIFAEGIGAETFAAWRSSGRDKNGILVGLQNTFVNVNADDLRLSSNSPAIGLGQTTYLNQGPVSMQVNKDFNGVPRDSNPDAGAFEASSGCPAVTGLSISKSSASLQLCKTEQLSATVAPSDACDKSLTWSSNNTTVATVDSTGLVTAHATGTATITVKSNNGGYTKTCAVTVTATQTPYNNVTRTIPGRIEAEDYDTGGECVAYHDDVLGNAHLQYRNEDVDIKVTGDILGGGYDIGQGRNGEWLEYTLDATAGAYNINARVGSAKTGNQLVIKLDGNTLGIINVPNLGNWNDKSTQTIPGVNITGGKKVLRLEIVGDGVDINWIEFTDITTNIAEEGNSQGLVVFPNPFKDDFTIQCEEKFNTLKLDITDVTGRVVLSNNYKNNGTAFTEKIDMQELPAGLYFIVMQTETETKTVKIIKQD